MQATFLVTLEIEAADPVAVANEAEELHAVLESQFDVVDVKPWARPSMGIAPVTPTGAPPITGAI